MSECNIIRQQLWSSTVGDGSLPFLIKVFAVICLLIFLFTPIIIAKEALGWTYDQIWWFGESQSDSAANVQIVYTYPDEVQIGKQFNVGLTLDYLKENEVRSSWIVFSNITFHLLANHSSSNATNLTIVNSSESKTSKLISAGEQYSLPFNLTAPESLGNYVLGLTLTAFFGPGSGSLQVYDWDTRDYYNQTWRDHGIIYPTDLPSIKVVKNESSGGLEYSLVVALQKPYFQLDPVTVEISSIKKDEVKVDELPSSTVKVVNGRVSIPITHGKATLHLPHNSFYNVRIPQFINMSEGIRAEFTNWSDGQEHHVRNGKIERTILLDRNTELFALFKTQFYLSVESNESNTEGSSWYDAGKRAHYTVKDAFTRLWTSFDHWVGDISTETDDIPSGHLTMDGPKTIKAVWRLDFTYLGIISGAIASIAASVEVFINRDRVKGFMQYIGNKTRKQQRTEDG